jgi:maltose/moltooligosaccharide transporter
MSAVWAFLFMVSINRMYFFAVIGCRIAWASMMGIRCFDGCAVVPKERYGVYMGIINMMLSPIDYSKSLI